MNTCWPIIQCLHSGKEAEMGDKEDLRLGRCVVCFGGHWKGGVVVDMIKVHRIYLYEFKMINNF